VLPEYVITILLVLVLGATTYKTFKNGEKQWAKELADRSASGEVESCCETLSHLFDAPQLDICDPNHADEQGQGLLVATETKAGSTGSNITPELQAYLDADAQMFPWWKIAAISFCFVLVVISNIMKLQLTECGDVGYWVLMMAPVVITLSMMFMVRLYLVAKGDVRIQAGPPYDPDSISGDVKWDSKTTIVYPLVCTFAGLFAGMFGIGGGIVKGPLMLEMEVLPQVSAATAAFMILFTAASATMTYAAFDQVLWDYALILFPCGFFCTVIGQVLINSYIKRTGNSSVIVFIIALIVGLATLLMGYQSGTTAWKDIQDGVGMHDICEK